jgi:hypothetical protein
MSSRSWVPKKPSYSSEPTPPSDSVPYSEPPSNAALRSRWLSGWLGPFPPGYPQWGANMDYNVQADRVEVALAERVEAGGLQELGARHVHVAQRVVQAQRQLDAAGAEAQPVLPAVVAHRPVDRDLVVARGAEVAAVELHADAQALHRLRRHVERRLGHREAALRRANGHVLVRRRVQVALRHEPVDLQVAGHVLCRGGEGGRQHGGQDERPRRCHGHFSRAYRISTTLTPVVWPAALT